MPLRGRITRQLASCCIARLLVLATEDRQKAIVTYIDSPGGSAEQSLGIISTMNGIHSPVVTFCRGPIGGAAVVIAAHGLKGFRTADPGAHFSLRLPRESSRDGHRSTHESYLKLLAQTLARDTGNPEAQVLLWLTEGAEFSPADAVRNGFIDTVAQEPLLPEELPAPGPPTPPA